MVMVASQPSGMAVEEAVALVQVCAWDPSGGSMQECYSQHIAEPMPVDMGTVMGEGAVLKGHRSEGPQGWLVPGSESTGTVPCTSSAARVVEGERRAQTIEDRP